MKFSCFKKKKAYLFRKVKNELTHFFLFLLYLFVYLKPQFLEATLLYKIRVACCLILEL